MSRVRANKLVNRAGTGAPQLTYGAEIPVGYGLTGAGNINLTGTITAASFSGTASNATYATTAGIATVAQNLTGSPSITVSSITNTGNATVGGALTVTGNFTVNGTQTIINTTNLEITDPLIGIGSGNTTDAQANGDGIQIYGATNKTFTYNDTKKGFETNIPIVTNETRIISGAEKVHRQSGNTVTLTYNSSSSANVGYTTNPSGDITLNVTGIPTSSDFDDHSLSFALIVNNTGTARTCTAVNLNGVSRTIRWAGGSLATTLSGVTTTTGHTIFSFTGINTVGSASTAANYQVLGVVSGGFW
jgi:hypothetical protein